MNTSLSNPPSPENVPIALFRIGRIVSTPSALAKLQDSEILTALQRHQAGDWGDVNENDRQANNSALEQGGRLFSVYHTAANIKFWVITESDRSLTTILMPEDY